MKVKKALFGMLSLIVCLGTAVGCSSGSQNQSTGSAEDDSAAAPADSKESVVLQMWGGVPPESGPQEVVDMWNAEHPDVQVEYVRYVNDDAGNLKLDTALLTDQGVDLYVTYGGLPRLQKRVEAGAALDLGQFTDYNIDEKMGPMAAETKVDGKYYAMPTKRSIFFVWLNKNALDEAGLPVPFDWTWDDMKKYAETLTKDGRYGLVQHLEPYVDPIDRAMFKQGYVKQDGTSNLNNPYVSQWLTTLKGIMDTGATPLLGEQLTTKMPVESMFLKGEAAILNAGEWIFRDANNLTDNPRDFKIAFAPVPKLSKDNKDEVARGGLSDTVSINPKSKHIDEAWEFLKWYADGGMLPMAKGGRIPASKDADSKKAIEILLGDAADTYDQESLEKVVFGDLGPYYERNIPQQVMDLRREEYEKFFLGAQTLDQTLQRMAERHNEFLKQSK